MTRHDFHDIRRRAARLRRWPGAIVLGVCAAVATRFGIGAWWVRGATLLALLWAPLTTVLLYLLAAVLLARNPAWRWPA
ncbi:MAG: PspC domain-containing protein [Rhodospirillales bacterium]|nr:PspC domain-containing protein [Rhodospirillales bacterium]